MICDGKTCQPTTNRARDKVKEADKEDAAHILLLPLLLADQDDQDDQDDRPITDRSQGSSLRVTSQILDHFGHVFFLWLSWKVVGNTWAVLVIVIVVHNIG